MAVLEVVDSLKNSSQPLNIVVNLGLHITQLVVELSSDPLQFVYPCSLRGYLCAEVFVGGCESIIG